jgi:hypothetical protein
MLFMDKLKLLGTLNKIIFDVLSVISKKENEELPFEIGCKCASVEIQEKLRDMLKAIFSEFSELEIITREEDNVVCIEKK